MAEEELRWVTKREGAHRPKSRNTPGTDREIWHQDDTNDLLGPTESRAADIEEIVADYGYNSGPPGSDAKQPDWADLVRQIAEITEVLYPLYRKHVHPFVKEKAAEVAEWHRNRTKKPGPYVDTQPQPDDQVVTAAPSTEVDASATEPIVLTRDQFQHQVLLTLAAQRWVDQRKEALSRSVVVDDDLTPELRGAINLILDGKVDQVDDEIATLLAVYFRDALAADAQEQTLPVTGKPAKVLRLTEGDTEI